MIGDSITAGIDGEPEAESYAALVSRSFGQELVLNTGSGGSTTLWIWDDFHSRSRLSAGDRLD